MGSFDKILTFSKGGFKQFLVLTRHFFLRLFQNDAIAFEDQMRERVIGILALFAMLSGHLANTVLFKYSLMEDRGTSWVEKSYILAFFMVLMGFIAVLEWEIIFPDSRDYTNLMPLPVKVRTLFAAKFASLFLFVGMFALAMNAVAVFVFFFYLPDWISSSLLYGLQFMLVHLISSFAAIFFMFFISILLVAILMNILGHKIFSRISIYLRAVLLTAFFVLLISFLTDSLYAAPSFSSFLALKASNSNYLYLFPPMWFTGLYETLIGNEDPFFHGLSSLAVFSLLASIAAFYLTAGLGYRRYLKKMSKTRGRKSHFIKVKEFFSCAFDKIFLRNPVQRAVFYFFSSTIRRSMFHKMRLASFLAVAVGMMLVILAPQAHNLLAETSLNTTLLAIPLILSFFLLIGVKGIIKVPISLEANWIFQLTEVKKRHHYLAGLRKGIFFLTLIPLFVLLFIFYAFLWSGITALSHCFFGLTISVLLMEVLLIKNKKIPFTCSYKPGQEKVHVFWLLYIFLFLGYIYFMTWLEKILLTKPINFIFFLAVILILIIGIRLYQKYILQEKQKIIYEEAVEPVMVSLFPD